MEVAFIIVFFYSNAAVNDGAISWKGNDSKIEDCQFINNTFGRIRGTIYIGKVNNIITNSIFANCSSQLSDEVFFLISIETTSHLTISQPIPF